jgi:hypothetical protein
MRVQYKPPGDCGAGGGRGAECYVGAGGCWRAQCSAVAATAMPRESWRREERNLMCERSVGTDALEVYASPTEGRSQCNAE